MWEYRDTDELYHYGILGMKWGRRKSRYSSYKKKNYHKTSKDYRRYKAIKKKKVKEMSNKELDYINNRMNKEHLYRENRTKTLLKGAAVVGTVATIIGNMDKIYENGGKMIDHSGRLINSGKNIIKKYLK